MHAAELSANERLRDRVAALAARGAPVAAECAGLLYLARTLDDRPMCGVLDVRAAMTPKLTLGYRQAVAVTDSVLARAGDEVRGHEFHRTAAVPRAESQPAWRFGSGTARGPRHRIGRRLLPAHPLGRPPGRGGQVHRRLREGACPMKRLIGVGVGPGDPELVTVKAVRVLREADVVLVPVLAAPVRTPRPPGPDAAAAAGPPEPGRAETIIRAYVDADRIKRLEFALNDTGGVTPRRAAAWQAAAAAVAEEFAAGAATVAFGTLGDPNLYSTFSYLAQTVLDLVPEVTVETVAGITAMQDLASRAGISLAEGTEPVTLVPLNGGVGALDQALARGGTVVGYKVGAAASPAPGVLRDRLQTAGRLDGAVIGARLGLAGELIAPAADLLRSRRPGPPRRPGSATPKTFRTFRICPP